MFIKSIEIEGFRNIKKAELLPDERLNIIAGQNAMGKTNLIEAIYMLTGAKSFRKTQDKNIIGFEEEKSSITAEIQRKERSFCIRVLIERGEKVQRRGNINDTEWKRASSLAGNFCAVVFSPDHLGLVKGNKEGRRYFLDNAVCNIYPTYIEELHRYNRVLGQRNNLLKYHKIKGFGSAEHDLLDVIDVQLSTCCEKVVKRRAEYIEGLKPLAVAFYEGISEGREQLHIEYESRANKSGEYLELLKSSRESDLKTGYTGIGAHRDDIAIKLSSLTASNFASQGQQRSIVLAMKQAEAKYYQQLTGTHPILLFDDVLSELDPRRQKYLLKGVNECQTFFTACDTRIFGKTAAKIFYMENGELSEKKR